MTDRPVIMSAPMVRALLQEAAEAGTGKQMTRRLAWRDEPRSAVFLGEKVTRSGKASPWQRVQPGDRLWVKENFFAFGRWQGTKKGGKVSYHFERRIHSGDLLYAADHEPVTDFLSLINNRGRFGQSTPAWHLRPSIFMERQHSRLTLVVTATKIERLNDISEVDCEREGCKWNSADGLWRVPGVTLPSGADLIASTARNAFAALWDAIHGSGQWLANPEVVAVKFTVHAQNIDAMKDAA